jgi:hypothetical protein
VLGFLSLALLISPTSNRLPQDSTTIEHKVARLAEVQKGWGPKMNSPGVAISLEETARGRTAQGTAVHYRLIGSGLQRDEIYTLFSVSLELSPSPVLPGVTFDRSGVAVCAGREGTCRGERADDPVDLVVYAAKGEPKRFAITTADNQVRAFAYVVPFGIVGKDRGCTVEAILLTSRAEAVLIRAGGFQPHTEIHFIGVSEGEAQKSDSTADDDGNLFQVALPYVKGKSQGRTKVSLQSKDCSPSITFEWGEGRDHNQ